VDIVGQEQANDREEKGRLLVKTHREVMLSLLTSV
jgi:hypothetical protein